MADDERTAAGRSLGHKAARAQARMAADRLAPGLSETELSGIEAEFGFEFSDDHRAFLSAGLPLDKPLAPALQPSRPWWPDWRNGDPAHLKDMLDRPVEGVLFDVAENDFWYEPWGPRPPSMTEALVRARRRLSSAPRMVPVAGHRYLPAGRGSWGHPVLSMYQTDIIFYGANLLRFIEGGPRGCKAGTAVVAFWRDLVH